MPPQPTVHSFTLAPGQGIDIVVGSTQTTINGQAIPALTDVPANNQSRSPNNPQNEDILISFDIVYNTTSTTTTNPPITTSPEPNPRYNNNPEITRQIAEFRATVERPGSGGRRRRGDRDSDAYNDAATQTDLPGRPSIHAVAASMLGFLPRPDLGTLPKDARVCSVCQEGFATSGPDEPRVLRCQHVFGRRCIELWILGGNNSCPMCRSAIFEPAGSIVRLR